MEKIGVMLFVVALLAGCSLQVGVEWTGKTDKDNRQYSPKMEAKERSWWW